MVVTLLVAGLALTLTAGAGAGDPASSAPGVGSSSAPITGPFDLCPNPAPLPFGPRSEALAQSALVNAVPVLYRGIKTAGFRIAALNPAKSTASGDYGALVAHACGGSTQQRTYVAVLVFPAMLPSASLSTGVLYLSRFERGWRVWGEFPPGPQPASTSNASPTSLPPTTAEPGTTRNSTPPQDARGPIYLALGDSAPIWDGSMSYPNLVAASYRSRIPDLELVNLAVSGATTTSMLASPIGGEESQQQQAVAFLRAHRGDIALVTIDIGGNDILVCTSGTDSETTAACLNEAEKTMGTNLHVVLTGLRQAAGPTVPIVGMTYYDPYLGDWLAGGNNRAVAVESVTALVHLNDILTRTYNADGVMVANVQGSFQSTNVMTDVASPWGKVPIAVYEACTLLDITCQAGRSELFGDDPNSAGSRVIAKAFESTIGALKSLH